MKESIKNKECPSCAMMIEKNSRVCPVCGYEFPQQKEYLKITAIILIILLIVFFLFVI